MGTRPKGKVLTQKNFQAFKRCLFSKLALTLGAVHVAMDFILVAAGNLPFAWWIEAPIGAVLAWLVFGYLIHKLTHKEDNHG